MSETKVIETPNLKRRQLLAGATGVVGAVGAAFVAVPFVGSWQPSERAKAAGAPVNADISQMKPGQMLTVNWRGKPVWVVRRTPAMLEQLAELDDVVRDPMSESSVQPAYAKNATRAINPEYLVVVGICTHLGCSPLYRPAPNSSDMAEGWRGGFFCPCHGSSFDLAGRVFRAVPAPTNLEVPIHGYLSETVIRIGEEVEEGGLA
jgi:ubiquinol-cytochrome c reductase iron-sulfur subunit